MSDQESSRVECTACKKLYYRFLTGEDRCGLCVNAECFKKLAVVKQTKSTFNSSFIINDIVFRRSLIGDLYVNEAFVDKEVVQALRDFLK
jgi:hypothetical protein